MSGFVGDLNSQQEDALGKVMQLTRFIDHGVKAWLCVYGGMLILRHTAAECNA